MMKAFNQLCLLVAGFFLAASIMLVFVHMTGGSCRWTEPIFGPAVVCEFRPLGLALMNASALSWYWISFALLLMGQHAAAGLLALPMIGVNILAFRGFAILLKSFAFFQNPRNWRRFLIGFSVFAALVIVCITGLLGYLLSFVLKLME